MFSSLPCVAVLQKKLRYRLRHFQAVHGGTDYAARMSAPFPHGKKRFEVALKSFVTHHLYGRGSACFHPRQHSASVKAFHFLPENMQRLHNGVGNFPRQQPTQIRRHHTTGITWRNVKNCRFVSATKSVTFWQGAT